MHYDNDGINSKRYFAMLDRYPPRDSAGLVTKSLKILSHDILQDKWLISPCSHDANYCKHWYNKSQKHPYLITHGGMKCVCANKLRLDIAVSVYLAYPGYTTLDYGPIEILIKYTQSVIFSVSLRCYVLNMYTRTLHHTNSCRSWEWHASVGGWWTSNL